MRQVQRCASPAVTVAVLVVVIWRLGTGPLLDGVEAVDGRALLAAAAVMLATTVFSAWRWTIVARGLGVGLGLRPAISAYYRAMFLNLTLPSGLAGDVHRGVSHGRAVHDVGRALRAVIWERGAGQVVQAVLTVAVLLVLPSPVHRSMPFVAGGAVLAAAVVLLVGRVRAEDARSRWTRARILVTTDIRNAVLCRRAWPAIVLASAVVVVGHTVTFLIAARTVGATAPMSRLLPLAVIALLAMVLPSVAGWGPREGVTAWAFSAAGFGAERGAAAAVTYGVLVLVGSLPGAIVLLVGWLPRRRLSENRPMLVMPASEALTLVGHSPDAREASTPSGLA